MSELIRTFWQQKGESMFIPLFYFSFLQIRAIIVVMREEWA